MALPILIGIAAAGAGLIKSQVEKSKEADAIISAAEVKCAKDVEEYEIYKTGNEFQEKMQKLLLEHSFSKEEKQKRPPLSSDWKHLATDIHIFATRKYSMLSWGEYAFYTKWAVYYHNKRKGIHDFLYYDGINEFDIETGIVDYGKNHTNKDISQWLASEKNFIEQIYHIWKIDRDTETSVLEFCFNNCHEFKLDLCYYRTPEIENTFTHKSKSKILQKYWKQIKIAKMQNGSIDLQFWAYFPKVDGPNITADDTEDDIYRKECEARERELEAEREQLEAEAAHRELLCNSSEIAQLFQSAIYSLYGIHFTSENIVFLEDPDFTYEGPSFLDRVSGITGKMADITSQRMADVQREHDRAHKNN